MRLPRHCIGHSGSNMLAMNYLTLPLQFKTLRATVSELGGKHVLLDAGWTIGVSGSDVETYLDNFARDPLTGANGGFHHDGDHFIVSHKDAKLALPAEDGLKLVSFLQEHFSQS